MAHFVKAALAFSLLAALTTPLLAQQPPRPLPGVPGAYFGTLLKNKAVQEDLKLTEEQAKKAIDALRKATEDSNELSAKLFDPTVSMEEKAEIGKKVDEMRNAALKDSISAEQFTRLKQIQLQVRMYITAVRTFADSEIAKTLKLTDEQKADLNTLGEAVFKEIIGLTQDGFNDATQKKVDALNKEGLAKGIKMLTDDQKKAFDSMVGKTFEDVSNLVPRRPMRPMP